MALFLQNCLFIAEGWYTLLQQEKWVDYTVGDTQTPDGEEYFICDIFFELLTGDSFVFLKKENNFSWVSNCFKISYRYIPLLSTSRVDSSLSPLLWYTTLEPLL